MLNSHRRLAVIAVLLVGLGCSKSTARASQEAQIRAYFADIPVMISIARCESTFRQHTARGDVLYDPTGRYIGAFQIAHRVHSRTARALGYNLTTLEGNMRFARWLYTRQGTKPWKGCAPKA